MYLDLDQVPETAASGYQRWSRQQAASKMKASAN
jgi:hypothetical protein